MAGTITYIGHATALIESPNGKKIIIDPWLEGNPLCPKEFAQLDSVDVICLTHGHADHASSAAPLAKKTGATIFATYELAMLLMGKEGVPDSQIQPMNKGGEVEVPDSDGIRIALTNAFHSSSFDASDGTTYYAGEPCGVVITLEDDVCIYHAGDTCFFKDMKWIRKTYQPDVALLPIGDRFTMDPSAAAQAVELLKPNVAIPIHHSTFPLLTGTPEQFEKAVGDSKTKVVSLKPGETFKL